MEQITFDSSYLLRPATFLEDFKGSICDVLLDLVPFVQLKKREKHPWRSVNFSNFSNVNFNFNHSNCSHPSLEVVYLFLS